MKEIGIFVAALMVLFTVIGAFTMMFTDAEGAFGISAGGLGVIGFIGLLAYGLITYDD